MVDTKLNLTVKLNIKRDQFALKADLSLPLENMTACFGPSGAGKTTFLRHLVGLDKSPKTSIVLDGDILQDDDSFIETHRRNLGFVDQNPFLFDHLNVEQNIMLSAKNFSTVINKDLLSELKKRLKIDNLMSRRVSRLSGGEKQRVAILRSLISFPKVVLWDEPLSAVGYKQKESLIPYLKNTCARLRIPIIYVTHSIDEILNYSDQIIIINDGKAEFSKNISQSLTKVQIPYLNRKGISVFLDAKVIRNDNRYGITIIETGIGRLSIPECQFEVGQRLRVRILSDDVSITLSKSKDSSISNIFKVKIKKIATDSKHMKIITLESGSTQIKARITKKSSEILNLELNDEVFAQIKTVAITY